MVYEWKMPGIYSKVDVQAVGETLASMEADLGGLRPEDVVKAAQKKRNPLHGCFEWDDAKAAHSYRVETARHILRSITVRVEAAPDAPSTRAFVVVERADERRYTNISEAMTVESYRASVLGQALEELRVFESKYKHLRELSGVFAAVREVVEDGVSV